MLLQSAAIPWRSLLSSPAVWGLVAYDFCLAWAMYMGLTQLPQYMKDVLHYHIASVRSAVTVSYTHLTLPTICSV